MSYALCYSPCFICKKVFGYNPKKVPSIRVNGIREPLCRNCLNMANQLRVKAGTFLGL